MVSKLLSSNLDVFLLETSYVLQLKSTSVEKAYNILSSFHKLVMQISKLQLSAVCSGFFFMGSNIATCIYFILFFFVLSACVKIEGKCNWMSKRNK